MFNKIVNLVKGGLIKLGIIQSLDKLGDHEDVALNEKIFKQIDIWKDLYAGYHKPFHHIEYQTIEGTKSRDMITLGLAKVSASEMASLVYNEKCEISIDDEAISELVEEVFNNNKFHKKFQDYLEYSFAHGGMVVKPYVENDKIMLSFVTADSFIPISWKNDSIYEAVFPFEFQSKDKKYTHLEWHLWEENKYVIRNEVYESQHGDDLGVKVPLRDHFPGLEEEVFIDGLKRSIFSYFKPNTANNIDTDSPLGISLFANALDTMKSIDVAFDSFHREFRLGKKRIIVPESMIKTVYDTDGQPQRYFDSSDETYESFNTGNMDDAKIHDISVELRVDEHIAAINSLLNLFAMQTGFSSGAFTFDGQSMKTATEVISEQSKTFKSKQSHEVIIEAALQELIGSIVAMAELYDFIKTTGEYEATVTFDDSIAEDKTAETDREVNLVMNQLQSRKRAIMKIFGVTEEEAIDIVTEIAEEQKQSAPMIDDSILFGARE